MKLSREPQEYRNLGPMSVKEKKIILVVLGYFGLLALVVIYFFFFSGVVF